MNSLSKYSDEDLLKLFDANIKEELQSRGYEFGWHKQTEYAGDIYIMVNPAFPDLVKIGYADNVSKRLRQFNRNSGLPDPFHVYATYKVKKRLEDLKLHELIDSLDPDLRHAKNREFYEMSKEKAYKILTAIAEINGDEDLLSLNPLKDDFFSDAMANISPSKAHAVAPSPINLETRIGNFNETKAQRREFWKQFVLVLQKRGSPFAVRSLNNVDAYYDVAMGTTRAKISIGLVNKTNCIDIHVRIWDDEKLYKYLLSNRNAIEQELEYELKWNNDPNKKSCTIRHDIPGLNFKDHSNYDVLMNAAIDEVLKFRNVFSKYVQLAP